MPFKNLIWSLQEIITDRRQYFVLNYFLCFRVGTLNPNLKKKENVGRSWNGTLNPSHNLKNGNVGRGRQALVEVALVP